MNAIRGAVRRPGDPPRRASAPELVRAREFAFREKKKKKKFLFALFFFLLRP